MSEPPEESITPKYTEISKNQLTAIRNEICRGVADRLEVSDGFAYIMLNNVSFEPEHLLRTAPDPAIGEAKTNFLRTHKLIPHSRITRGISSCSVCCHEGVYVFGMQCDHNACKKCYGDHITKHIKQGRLKITCIGCRMRLSRECIMHWIEENSLINQYLNLELDNFRKKYKYVSRCSINCGKIYKTITEVSPLSRLTVHCGCGALFCFECESSSHPFFSCSTQKNWILMCLHEAVNFGKLAKRGDIIIQPCHNCYNYIERYDGCAEMECASCKTSYCYHCGAPMDLHKQADQKKFCQEYKKKFVVSDLQLPYIEKFQNEEAEMARRNDIRNLMGDMYSDLLPQTRIDFYFKFVDSLHKLKQHLYGYQCFVPGDNKTEIFLQKITEKSQYLFDVMQWFRQMNGMINSEYIVNLKSITKSIQELVKEIEKCGNCIE